MKREINPNTVMSCSFPPFSKFPSTYTSRKDFEGNGVSLTMPSEAPERNSHHIRRKKDGRERRKSKGKYSKKKTALPEG